MYHFWSCWISLFCEKWINKLKLKSTIFDHVKNLYLIRIELLDWNLQLQFLSYYSWRSGWDSAGSIVTCYRLDGLGIESRWGRDFLHLSSLALGPTQVLYIGYRVFPRIKPVRYGIDHPPVSCTEVTPPLGLLACSRVNFMVPLKMEIIFDINIYFDCLLSHKVFISVIPVFCVISRVMKEEKLANIGVIFATWR